MPGRYRYHARPNPGRYFSQQLILGVLVLLGASWVFGSIADEVLEQDAFAAIDHFLSQWLNAMKTPGLTDIMLKVSAMHGVRGMSLLVLVTALALLWKKYGFWLMVMLLAVPGGALLNVLMKQVFERARPQLDSPVLALHDYSFPSGHTCASTLFYGVLAALLVSRTRSWRRRALACAMALGMVALVAFSRLYLGAHFLSDVLGGFAEGVAWLALCMTATHTYVRHRGLIQSTDV